MELVTGKIESAQKAVIYGPEGIGKSTLASRFPGAVFIDTEGSTKAMDVARTPAPSSWAMLMEQIRYFMARPGELGTLVIDTADWAEMMCMEKICAQHHKSSIEEFGYGKGYTYLAEEFGRFLNCLNDLVEKGVHCAIVAHAQMRKFEQPDELGSYDRWEMKLQKKVGPMVKEWADMVLFANYEIYVVKTEEKKNRAQGGKRVLHAAHHPCWDAKNRHGLEDKLPMDFGAIAHCFGAAPKTDGPAWQPRETSRDEGAAAAGAGAAQPIQAPPRGGDVPFDDYSGVPKALADLMMADGVSVKELQAAVAYKGYYPIDTPIENYDPHFVSGSLVAAWQKVLDIVNATKEDKAY